MEREPEQVEQVEQVEQDREAEEVEPSAEETTSADVAEAVTEDLDELRAKAGERDEFLSLAQRTQADFENFRKRAARDARAAETRGIARVVRELLPALDNLERAIAAAESQVGRGAVAEEHHLTDGIRLVRSELVAAFGRVGVEGFSPEGEAFDPTVHEALSQQPVDGADPGTVVEVLQPGYRLEETIIRPARVVVAG